LPKLLDAGAAVPRLRAVDSVARFNKQNPFAAEVLAKQKITGGKSSKDVRHIELSLEGSGLSYEPGDALAVVVPNPPKLVAQLIAALDLQADEPVLLNGEQNSLDKVLTTEVEVTALNLGFLRSWATASAAEPLNKLLSGENQKALADFVDTHQIIDIVRQFPARVSAQEFVSSLRKLSPRSYSIASSQNANPDEVHLTVAAVRYDAFGSEHWGAASTHLADRLDEGDMLPVYIEQNSRFRLPDDDDAPIIMIGPGTGVAPFRAFVEERAERNATGRNWLFFGDRTFSDDFLYQLEWQRHLRNAHLDKLDVAFSRDQREKIYVQDRLRERATELFSWLERGAYIYVCGDSKNMAGDVNDALIDIIAEQAGLDRAAAEQHLKDLRRAGRYQRDVY
jgi:sulfite reductase (NADPH) flavoprotein alpha-component